MVNVHPLKNIIKSQKGGLPEGIVSICSANRYVIEAAMENALTDGRHILIEATANQVNQYGGYTGMKPSDFHSFIHTIADKINFPSQKIILGGDHLGPLVWKNEKSDSAMQKSRQLIREYVMAGFTKIHLDTSMKLADDNREGRPDSGIIALRGAILAEEAENAFKDLKRINSDVLPPVYVIGSEVPVPGGSGEADGEVKVTTVDDFKETVGLFKEAFFKRGLENAWDNVIAVVVQPGVEFGDKSICEYKREKAADLCAALKEYPNLVFEGHSTDYQTAEALKQMMEDGIAILKVGPALTFALREALFMLNLIENELFSNKPDVLLSDFINALDKAMLDNPEHWKKHYQGNVHESWLARKYSLYDRCRYYLNVREVKQSIELLISNLRSTVIPLSLISQYLPVQYDKIRRGILANEPEALIKDKIVNILDNYKCH